MVVGTGGLLAGRPGKRVSFDGKTKVGNPCAVEHLDHQVPCKGHNVSGLECAIECEGGTGECVIEETHKVEEGHVRLGMCKIKGPSELAVWFIKNIH